MTTEGPASRPPIPVVAYLTLSSDDTIRSRPAAPSATRWLSRSRRIRIECEPAHTRPCRADGILVWKSYAWYPVGRAARDPKQSLVAGDATVRMPIAVSKSVWIGGAGWNPVIP